MLFFLISFACAAIRNTHRAVVLVCKLAHSLDEFGFIQLFIAVDVILLEEVFKFGPESLSLFDSEQGVWTLAQTGEHFVHRQVLISINIES